VKLSSTFGKIKTISDVIHIRGFMKNMLLIGMIVDKGHTIVFDFNKCLIIQNKDPHTIVVKNVKDPKNGLYKLEMHSIKSFEETQETYITKENLKESTNMDQHQTLLWHKRMVHLHYQVLYTMSAKTLASRLRRLAKASFGICADCMVCKQSRKVIPKNS
jgi:RNA polymerase-binding transcription factor DksA